MAKEKNKTPEKQISLEAKDFYSDFYQDGMLYAALIRSPAVTGKVSGITIPDLPENYFLFTAKDVPGENKISINETPIQIFTQGNVSYKGEVLGIVCGENKDTVNHLAETAVISFDINSLESAFQSIEKKYKKPALNLTEKKSAGSASDFSSFLDTLNELPSLDTVQSTRNSSRSESERILGEREIKTGLYKKQKPEDAEKEIFTDDVIEFSGTWELNQINSIWQETSGTFCKMEKGILHIYTASKWAFLLQNTVSQALSLPQEKILIHKTKTTGMFSNGMWKNAVLSTQVAIASFLTGKPVKLVFSQEEQEEFMKPGVFSTFWYKTGVTRNGLIKSMHLEVKVDAGSDNPYAQEIVDRLVIASTGLYKPENLYINAKAVSSATPPSSIFPRIIDAQSFYALENHIQEIAKDLQLLPDEFRIKNIERKDVTFPFNIPATEISETLSKSIQESDFNRKFISFGINASNRARHNKNSFFALPLRGIGFSCAYDGSGYLGETIFSCDHKMEVTFTASDKVEIHSIKPSSVVESIWKKKAAEILQIEPSAVSINSSFPASEIPNIPEETSSNISVMTYLLTKCCQEIQKKRFHSPLPLKSKKTLPNSVKSKWNNEGFTGTPFHASSFASAVIELEMDPYTYMEKIKGLWMTINCGQLFDKKAAERTIKLAIQQELTTLVENSTITTDNYHIFFINSEESPAQIGELVHNTIPAAFSSALSLALSTRISTLPVSQDLLYELIKQREIESKIEKNETIEETPDENSNDA